MSFKIMGINFAEFDLYLSKDKTSYEHREEAPVEKTELPSTKKAKRKELRHLYDHHPELWARMLELQAIPGKVSEKFNCTQKFSDIDAVFRQADEDTAQAAA